MTKLHLSKEVNQESLVKKMLYLPPPPEIGIIDFLIISSLELAFIQYFLPKRSFKQVFPIIISANLIKVGIFSLLASVFLATYLSTYYNPLIELTLILVPGTLVATFIYEKEELSSSRQQAGLLAFLITSLSSLVWWTFDGITPQYRVLEGEQAPTLFNNVINVLSESFLPIFLGSDLYIHIGLVLLGIGLLILVIFHHKREKGVTRSSWV
ncbi:MAG: hypothetical protein ACXAC8_03865 [Candidatus Hodarchaeales archaeon]|jgi:hypothetical protein